MHGGYIMKNKLAAAILLIASILLVSGAGYLAAAASGTQADPLVTLSYLTDRFRPQILDELRDEIARSEQAIRQRVDSQVAEINARLPGNQGGAAQPGGADTFTVVTLRNGQRLNASAGTEIMLRIGTASARAASTEPALVNTTTGSTLANGSSVTANHMYLVTISGNGVTAASDTVRLLVRGEHTISG
jgi:hypothetical protein